MDVLSPLRVFLEKDQNGKHFTQAHALMERSGRLLSFVFVSPPNGRYCVPALCGFGDVALYVSNDRVIDFDAAQLWKDIRKQDLCCVYVPKAEKDSPTPSMMLFRNKYCERLTPGYVFNAKPEDLIPSVWAGGPQNIGTLEV